MSKPTAYAWRITSVSFGVALLLALFGWASLSQSAFAASDQPLNTQASIVVNTSSPGINDDGLCSIIEAIENANFDALTHDDCVAGSGADTIALPIDAIIIFTTSHNLVSGENALPVITSTVSIVGNNATLIRDAGLASPFRFFYVAAEGNLTLDNLGMRFGQAGTGGTAQLLDGGGAVLNQGTLNIANSNLSYNGASFGGAVYSQPITGSMSIVNTTFSGNEADLFGGAVYNNGLANISGGILRLNVAGSNGGAILHDSSTLIVTNATLQDNTAGGSGAAIAARALMTDSSLQIQATVVVSNVAAINGGGIYNTAMNGLTSVVEVAGGSVIANRAMSTNAQEGVGGGILNGWPQGDNGGVAVLNVRQASVTDNVAQMGGGIANLDGAGYITRTATVGIYQSTLARNTAAGLGSAQGSGGGLYNSNGTAIVANSTLSGNQAVGDDEAEGGRGGGIGNVGRGITTTVQVFNTTIAFNEATQAGGGIAVVGQITTTPTTLDVGNTLVVSNVLSVTESVTNTVVLARIAATQVITGTESCSLEDGTTLSRGGNIEDGNTCGFNNAADLENTSVDLGALADNGGPTFTHLITQTGAAFDGGQPGLCTGSPINDMDQRGVLRPQSVACDVGAVELQVEPPVDDEVEMYFPQIYRFHSFQ